MPASGHGRALSDQGTANRPAAPTGLCLGIDELPHPLLQAANRISYVKLLTQIEEPPLQIPVNLHARHLPAPS
jgi:hypothetical protein